ncbi:MAG: Uma2 family endonuclease [Planctomycetaceae bacterium]|nr:Uma2 family endonuclease [Planctomycetaceae bacterium]
MTAVVEPGRRQSDDSLPSDVVLYEMVDGKLAEKEVSAYAAWIILFLGRRLASFCEEPRIGTVTTELVFILDSRRNLRRRPDVAIVGPEKWPLDQPPPPTGDWDLVPNLTVEITSPHDSIAKVMRKVRDYFRHGVTEVWVVIPERQVVQVYRSISDGRTYGVEDVVTSDLLPGWSMPVAELLPHDLEPEFDEPRT